MPNIKISDLHPTGSDLFSDSENYMNELGDSELEMLYGGLTTGGLCRGVKKASKAVSRKVGEATRAVKRDPKGAARKVARKTAVGASIEITIQLSTQVSNPF
jgi:hypothetical protein